MIEFPASGITLVYGNTASGKSSLIDAIYSAIFIPSTNKLKVFGF